MLEKSTNTSKRNCKRCGKCCYYILNGVKKKCRHLVRLPSGKHACRIYRNRLYAEIDKGIVCIPRVLDTRMMADCPYNDLLIEPYAENDTPYTDL